MKFVFIVFTALLLGNNTIFAAATSQPDILEGYNRLLEQMESLDTSKFENKAIIEALFPEILNSSLNHKICIRQAMGLPPVKYKGLDSEGKITLETTIQTLGIQKTLKDFIDESSSDTLRDTLIFYLHRNRFDIFLVEFFNDNPVVSVEPGDYDSFKLIENKAKYQIALPALKRILNRHLELYNIGTSESIFTSKRKIKLVAIDFGQSQLTAEVHQKFVAITQALQIIGKGYQSKMLLDKHNRTTQPKTIQTKSLLTIPQTIALYEKHREEIKKLNVRAPNFKTIGGQKFADAISISQELKRNRYNYFGIVLPLYEGFNEHGFATLDTPLFEPTAPLQQTIGTFVHFVSPERISVGLRFYTTRNLLDYYLNILYEQAAKITKLKHKKEPFSAEKFHEIYSQYKVEICGIKSEIYCFLDTKKLTNISDSSVFLKKIPFKFISSATPEYKRAKYALKNKKPIDEFSPEILDDLYECTARKLFLTLQLGSLMIDPRFLQTNLGEHINSSKPAQRPTPKKKKAASASSSSKPTHLIEYPTKQDVKEALPHFLTELSRIKSSREPITLELIHDYIEATDLAALNITTSQLRRRIHLEAWINDLFDSQKNLISVRIDQDPLTFPEEYKEYKTRRELLRLKLAEKLGILPLSKTPVQLKTQKADKHSDEWQSQVRYKLAVLRNIQNTMKNDQFLKISQQKRKALEQAEIDFKNQRVKANIALLEKEEAEKKRIISEQSRLKAEKTKAANAQKQRAEAEKKRIAQEKAAEAKRIAKEKKRITEEKIAEQKRLAAEREAARKQAEAERKAQEDAQRRQAEMDRLAQEEVQRRQAEAERLADEIAEQRAQEAREQAARWVATPDFIPPPTHFVQTHPIVYDEYGRAVLLAPYYGFFYGHP